MENNKEEQAQKLLAGLRSNTDALTALIAEFIKDPAAAAYLMAEKTYQAVNASNKKLDVMNKIIKILGITGIIIGGLTLIGIIALIAMLYNATRS